MLNFPFMGNFVTVSMLPQAYVNVTPLSHYHM